MIAGRLRGRRLRVPAAGVRPTADRVREALFARLGDLEGARVLDLYAGSGALGIESLSRGAASALFVERSGAIAAVLQANLDELGLGDAAELVRGEASAVARRLGQSGGRFDLVFVDPPYRRPQELGRVLRALATSGILAPAATVVIETARGVEVARPAGLELLDERRYGDTVIHRLVSAEQGAEAAPARAAGREDDDGGGT